MLEYREQQLFLTGTTSFLSPEVSPRDRWCCGRRGRGPAAHTRDARLRPSPAPSSRGFAERALAQVPTGTGGRQPAREPGRRRSEPGRRAGAARAETDGRTGQCGGGKTARGRGSGRHFAAGAPGLLPRRTFLEVTVLRPGAHRRGRDLEE